LSAPDTPDDVIARSPRCHVVNDPRRIVCFHLNQIGDLIFSLPALYNLRARYPGAHIAGITRPSCRDLLLLSGLVDEVIERDDGSFAGAVGLGRQIKRDSFDLVLLFSTSPSAWVAAHASRIRVKAGFRHCVGALGFQYRVPWSPPPSTENNLRLVEAIGCPLEKKDYVGLVRPGEIESSAAAALLARAGVGDGERIAVISPGASKGRDLKRWPDKTCAQAADALRDQFGLTPVIVGMRGDADGITALSRRARDITGQTSLPVLAGVLARSSLFVGTDSGVMHLAGAVGTPVVALFGPSDFRATGPQGENHRIVHLDLPCRPCMANECTIGRPCMEDITRDMVLDAVRDLVAATGQERHIL
jgi:ADP-heptose:LPS heptosyltransferase